MRFYVCEIRCLNLHRIIQYINMYTCIYTDYSFKIQNYCQIIHCDSKNLRTVLSFGEESCDVANRHHLTVFLYLDFYERQKDIFYPVVKKLSRKTKRGSSDNFRLRSLYPLFSTKKWWNLNFGSCRIFVVRSFVVLAAKLQASVKSRLKLCE